VVMVLSSGYWCVIDQSTHIHIQWEICDDGFAELFTV
jgi:hypothetical protein